MTLPPVRGQAIRSRVPGHTVYKVRVRNTDAQRGKSGGYRVIYYLVDREDVLLVTVYSKPEQADIDADQIQQIIEEEQN
jgi:mRNA-degrading endonuclease RelE of RelBE toxin-antitoxin system